MKSLSILTLSFTVMFASEDMPFILYQLNTTNIHHKDFYISLSVYLSQTTSCNMKKIQRI